MSRDPRLTTKEQRDGFRRAGTIPVRLVETALVILLDDIDARIEREKKLREALQQCVEGEHCCSDMARRILAETADDE